MFLTLANVDHLNRTWRLRALCISSSSSFLFPSPFMLISYHFPPLFPYYSQFNTLYFAFIPSPSLIPSLSLSLYTLVSLCVCVTLCLTHSHRHTQLLTHIYKHTHAHTLFLCLFFMPILCMSLSLSLSLLSIFISVQSLSLFLFCLCSILFPIFCFSQLFLIYFLYVSFYFT